MFVLVESYPELSRSVCFRNLEDTLINLEESIQGARQYYNSVVRDFNPRISQVPTNIIANSFNFREREFFEVPEDERAVPKVSFSDGTATQIHSSCTRGPFLHRAPA